MTVSHHCLKFATYAVLSFVSDELVEDVNLSNQGTEGSFMNKPYCLRTNPKISSVNSKILV